MARIDKFTEVHSLETGVERARALLLCEQNDQDDAMFSDYFDATSYDLF